MCARYLLLLLFSCVFQRIVSPSLVQLRARHERLTLEKICSFFFRLFSLDEIIFLDCVTTTPRARAYCVSMQIVDETANFLLSLVVHDSFLLLCLGWLVIHVCYHFHREHFFLFFVRIFSESNRFIYIFGVLAPGFHHQYFLFWSQNLSFHFTAYRRWVCLCVCALMSINILLM